jgi:large subunit ribosomal protein L29
MAKGVEEIRNLDEEQLETFIEDLKKEIFELKNQLAMTRKLEKPHLIKEKRRDIARALMVLAEKRREGKSGK